MWVFDFFLYLMFWLHLFQNPFTPTAYTCGWYYDQELGDRLGIHMDPKVPPPCPTIK